MGSSYTNIQVRSKDYAGVVKALEQGQYLPAFVAQPNHAGWISVYPRDTEDQDGNTLKEIATALSKHLATGVFGLLVHDSDIFMYVLAENGSLKDEYDSDPGYFDGKNGKPTGGDTTLLLPYCLPGTSAEELASVFLAKKENLLVGAAQFMWHLARKDINKAFSSTVIFRGDTLAGIFAEKIGVERDRIAVGYKYIKQDHGDHPGLTLLRNEKEDLERARGKEGPPVLMSQIDSQMAMMPEESRKRFEEYAARGAAQQYAALVGEPLNWHGSVINSGGYSSGIRLTLSGPALAQSLYSEVMGQLEQWQGNTEENDYESPDANDMAFWPFLSAFVQSADASVWTAEFPDFAYQGEMLVRLPLVAAREGAAILQLTVAPITHDSGSAAKFSLRTKINNPPQNQNSAKQTARPAGVQAMGPYKFNFPAGWDVSAQSGGGIMQAMLGTKYTLRGFKQDPGATVQSQFDVHVAEIKEEKYLQNLSDRLQWARTTNRCRSFQSSTQERTTLGGIDFEIATWASRELKIFGLQALGTKGKEQIAIHATTHNLALLQEMKQIVLSFQ